MKATLEISMYPLSEKYETHVLDFIERVKQHDQLKVEVNGVSTQVFGEFDLIIDMLRTELPKSWEKEKSMFVFKMGMGELRYSD